MRKRDKFSYRAMVSFLMTLLMVVMAWSGVVLYIVPPGRIAHWANWKLMGLTKESWAALHTLSGFALVIGAAFHLYFNWSIFMGYLRRKLQAGVRMKRELAVATAVALVVLGGTVLGLPPFSSIVALGEDLKESWEASDLPPPVPHAELMTLEEFSAMVNIPLEGILEKLKNNGLVRQGESQTLGEIAAANGLSPAELDRIIRPARTAPSGGGAAHGFGYGQKTLEALCGELGIPLATAQSVLSEQGIAVEGNETVRDIASRAGLQPADIVNRLQGQ